MTPRTLTLLLLAASAAASVNNQITWGAIIVAFHGEKTPAYASSGYNLSPLGATQLLLAGSTVRDRYVSPPQNASQVTSAAPINGLSGRDIDNRQLEVLSTSDEYVSGSAMAFMQGLYPPWNSWVVDSETELSNGSNLEFPLNGYQYPNIAALSSLDQNYIWVAGNQDCTSWSTAELENLSGSGYNAEQNATQSYYDSIAPTLFGDLPSDRVNYYNAYTLYEYAQYKYNHDISFMQNTSDADMAELFNLASQQQFEVNTPNTAGTISAISGSTLAAKVISQFSQILSSDAMDDKLTLMFTSFEPFLAFFALSSLATGPAGSRFNSLPLHGSVMSFELFSYPTVNSTNALPDTSELWVRFLFRNGTDDSESLIAYPLFGRGNSETDMRYDDFVQGMGDFAINGVYDWCSACQSPTLFCEALEANMNTSPTPSGSTTTSKKSISPVLAGVIGACVTMVAFVLLAVLLLVYGFRMNKRSRDGEGIGVLKRTGSGGGFKGAEKLASDTDLRLKGGAGATVIRHERVGSWELNESPTSPTGKHASLDKEIESGRVVSTADYGSRRSEDGIDQFGDPVKAVDQV